MSEQAEAKPPTASEESQPQAPPPPSAETPEPQAATEVTPEPEAAVEAAPAEEPAPETEAKAVEAVPAEEPVAEPEAKVEEAAPSEEPAPEPEVKAEEPVPEPEAAVEAVPAEEPAPEPEAVAEQAEAEKAAEAAPAKKAKKKPKKKPPAPAPPAEPTEHDLEVLALREAKDEKLAVEGRVIGWNQGGFHVVVGTITAFCPRSEMELKNPKSPSFYLDKSFQFQVIKHQKRGRRIVLSRKALLTEEHDKLVAEMQRKLLPGTDLMGRVSSITDFGAFVDLGGVDGLVHITELSNRRVKNPREVVHLGQDVKVRVLRIESGGQRISLSMKVHEPNPWKEFAQGHPRGSSFEGKIVRKTDFGLFVELLPGLDGMVHLSQLPPGKSLDDPDFEVGKTLSGWVLKTESGRERISLSLKPVPADDPWKKLSERYEEGKLVEGEVEDVASFGVFVSLEPGLTGLLPNSETGVPRGQDVSRQYPPGKKVTVQITSLDPQRRRISLALEGAAVEGSPSDYRNYVRQQKGQGASLSTMAAAFAKLKQDRE